MPAESQHAARIAGVLLAGGRSRRMGGGDKSLRLLGGRPILARVIERVRPQVSALALNANGDLARFARFGLPVIADGVPGFPGPLAGVLAGLDWAAGLAGVTHVASFATDAPFLPRDLVPRLLAGLGGGRYRLACAASAGQAHPVFALWPLDLRDALRHALVEEAVRKVGHFAQRYALAEVDFPVGEVDPFFNANGPEDLAAAEQLLKVLGEA